MVLSAVYRAMRLAAALMLLGGVARAEYPLLAEEVPWPVGPESLAAREPSRQPDAVVAWSSLEPAALVQALRAGGLVLLVRHGQAVGSDRDPAPWRLPGDRRAQGNLTPTGKDQARLLGDGVRTLGIPIAKVVASPYVRARDFAEIAFRAKPVIAVDLGPENPGQMDAYRRYFVAPLAGGNLVVVGHSLVPTTASISQLKELADGHTAVWRGDGKGGQTLIALIAPSDWSRLAAAIKGG
jgi:phosphohistidine phosphatase SixA